jgi:hypothetical protein
MYKENNCYAHLIVESPHKGEYNHCNCLVIPKLISLNIYNAARNSIFFIKKSLKVGIVRIKRFNLYLNINCKYHIKLIAEGYY